MGTKCKKKACIKVTMVVGCTSEGSADALVATCNKYHNAMFWTAGEARCFVDGVRVLIIWRCWTGDKLIALEQATKIFSNIMLCDKLAEYEVIHTTSEAWTGW